MIDYVTDTHALFWYVINDSKLGMGANLAFSESETNRAVIHIPAIVIAELFFLNTKLGKPIDFISMFKDIEKSSQFVLTPFDSEDVLDFERDSLVSEMHDRMIVGLARRLNAPLITADRNIIESELIEIIW